MEDLLEGLNNAQYEAVTSTEGMIRVVAGAGSGESGVWHKTVICWLVLVAYLYIQCENYAFAALPLLVFAASKVRREPDFSRADASTRPEMDQNPE